MKNTEEELQAIRAELAEAIRVRNLAIDCLDAHLDEQAKFVEHWRRCVKLLREEGQANSDPIAAAYGADTGLPPVVLENLRVPSFEPVETPAPQELYKLKLLQALRSAEATGIPSLDRTWLAIIARVSFTSGPYRRSVGVLKKAGLIEFPASGKVSLTPKGRESTTNVQPFDTGSLMAAVEQAIEPAQFRIMGVLIEGDFITREELAKRSGQSANSSAYREHLRALKALGLIKFGPNSTVAVEPFILLRELAHPEWRQAHA